MDRHLLAAASLPSLFHPSIIIIIIIIIFIKGC